MLRPLFVLPCFALALFNAHSQELVSLDRTTSQLSQRIQQAATLALVVESSEDLPEAQRLLTLAASEEKPALILIALPSENRILAASIEKAARRFFKSEFSRKHVYFINSDALPFAPAKCVLLLQDPKEPLWRSDSYPDALP